MQVLNARSKVLGLILCLLLGVVLAYGLYGVHANVAYQAKFNFSADTLFLEQTHALRSLREGRTQQLESSLEAVAWEQLARLSFAKEHGQLLDARLTAAINYYCGRTESGVVVASRATLTSAQAHLCSVLVGK